ncbi:hypothetical protein RQP46_002458 [Phenoliferia psychrophenolica]
MARASFTTLPVELKARIVEMTSDQEGMWKTRVEDSKEEKEAEDADHINCLSSLALVNKELRELAAKHQFKLLPADRASHPVFRFIVLPRHGHRFTAIRLDDNDPMDGAELALSCMGQLPALRELNMTSQIASDLFGPGVTLRPDSDDMTTFQPSETVALIRRFPNLKTLWLIGLGDPDEDGHLHEFATLYNPPDDPLLPTDPTFLTFLDQQPSLNRLWLWDNSLNNGPGVNQESSPLPPPSFLSAYDRLVRSRGLDPSVLDQPHLGPFHPNAKLDFTKEDHEHLAGSLRRTLEFGLFELDRMVAEGSVARTVEWVPMLKALELERLAWKD